MREGTDKSKPVGPPFEEDVGVALCPLTGAEQGVATSPCRSVEQILVLYGAFPWHHVGQRNGPYGEEDAGEGPDEP